MLIRSGFISNSSSSSFIVTAGKPCLTTLYEDLLIVGISGITEFGWGPGIIYDIYSKINFAYLQVYYLIRCQLPNEYFTSTPDHVDPWLARWQSKYLDIDPNDWIKLIEDTIKENSNVKTIRNRLELDNSFIDHQSSVVDGKNTQMFDNKESMKRFLFDNNIWIILDNDNEENYEEYPGTIWKGEL